MSKKTVKVLSILLLSVLVLFGGVTYYISNKIASYDLQKLAKENLEQVFPGAEVQVGKIEYNVGGSIKLYLESLSLKLKDNPKQHLVMSKQLEVKIPLWAILTGGGTVNVTLNSPQVGYFETSKSNNWELALGRKDAKVADKTKKEPLPSGEKNISKSGKVEIPSYVYGSKLNLKIQDIALAYDLRNGEKGSFSVDRFLLKNISFDSETAIEISSKLNFENKKKEKISLNTLLVGSLDLREAVKTKSLSGNLLFEISSLSAPQLKSEIRDWKTNIVLKSISQKSGSVKLDSNVLGSKINAEVEMSADGPLVKKLHSEVNLAQIVQIVMGDIPQVNLKGVNFLLNGSMSIKKKKLIPLMDFKLSQPISYDMGNSNLVNIELSGDLGKGFISQLSIKNSLFGGFVGIKASAKTDPNDSSTSLTRFSPVNGELLAQNLNISEEFIQNKLYGKEKVETDPGTKEAGGGVSSSSNESKNSKGNKAKGKVTKAPDLPNTKFLVKLNGIKIGREDFSGSSIIQASKNKIYTKGFDFNFSKGTGKVSFNTLLGKNSSSSTDMNAKIENLNLNSLKALLPKVVNEITGIFSGSVKGNVKAGEFGENSSYSIKTDLNARNGEIKALDLDKIIGGTLAAVPFLGGKLKSKKISNKYKRLLLQGDFKNTVYNITKIDYTDDDELFQVKGSGVVYPPALGTEGYITLTIIDKKGELKLKKNIGTDELPIRLKGVGFDLKPDFEYTLSRVSKAASKKVINKAADKLKDKLLKKGGLKKIFKGFGF